MCTMMAGVILVIMAISRLGSAIQFIPRSVVIGFTNGIAVLIASTQIKDFFGLPLDKVPSAFVPRIAALLGSAPGFSLLATSLSLLTLGIVIFWPRVTKRMPGSIIALLFVTGLAVVMHSHVETIGSRFGGIPTGLPKFSIPTFRFDLIQPLLPSAVTVAMLAAIESLLSAVVADNMTSTKHRPDAELLAQGIANLIVPMVGGIPITGAIARTATNIRSGARTPVSGIVHGLTLLLVLLFAAPLAKFIPLCALAGILMVVCYNMGEWREIPEIFRLSSADRLVWGATFALTVFADLTVAVEVGMLLAALLYIYRVTDTTTVSPVTAAYLNDGHLHVLQDKAIPNYVTILRIHGPFLFGATAKLEKAASDLTGFNPIVILRLRNMTALDATGLHALEGVAERILHSGRSMLICGAHNQPAELISRSGLPELIGAENICPHITAALARAREVFEGNNDPGKNTQRAA
jgi:SulP family sulfate permease